MLLRKRKRLLQQNWWKSLRLLRKNLFRQMSPHLPQKNPLRLRSPHLPQKNLLRLMIMDLKYTEIPQDIHREIFRGGDGAVEAVHAVGEEDRGDFRIHAHDFGDGHIGGDHGASFFLCR